LVGEKTVETVIVEVAVVEDCESETVGGLNCVVGDSEPPGETDAERDTLPVNPSSPKRVRVTFPLVPASIDCGGGPEGNMKSAANTVIVVEFESELPVPETLTVYVPGAVVRGTVTFSVAEPVPPGTRLMLVGLNLAFSPSCV
jgi:hypothetical protein